MIELTAAQSLLAVDAVALQREDIKIVARQCVNCMPVRVPMFNTDIVVISIQRDIRA